MAFGGTIKIAAIRAGKMASVLLVVNRTVEASTTDVPLTSGMRPASGDFAAGSLTRSTLNLTAFASIGSPFENLTSVRSLNSQVVGSTLFQLVASQGMTFPFGSVRVIESNIVNFVPAQEPAV